MGVQLTNLDTDIALIWDHYKHLLPDLTPNHMKVYRLLWRIEPLSGERVIEHTSLSRATAYKILRELVEVGLVKKTVQKPVSYYAESPVKVYGTHADKLTRKLKRGREQMKKLLSHSSGLSHEVYLIKLEGGQTQLIHKESRQSILDEYQLKEIKKAIEQKIEEAEQSKLKEWQMVGR